MNKLLLISLIALSSCSDTGYLPPNARIISRYGNSWVRWELDGECFISYFSGYRGMMSKVECDLKER